MRLALAVLGALALAACATGGEFRVGRSEDALVIIGVAEAHDATESQYSVLWRKVDVEAGRFTDFDDARAFVAQTNADDTLRIDGIPGEFTIVRVQPGVYALDSVFGRIRDGRIDYIAQGLVSGPERPAFEVRAGEAVYLGIWQASIDNTSAVTRLWRLDPADLEKVVRESRATRGEVVLRETETRAVTCAMRWLNSYSQREIC